jgi:protein-histidine pros-kinase
MSPIPEPPRSGNTVNLQAHLLLRVTLFALVIGTLAVAAVLYQARSHVHQHLQRTGEVVERLIALEAEQPRGSFDRTLGSLGLTSLDSVGHFLGICVAVEDIYKRPAAQRCFGDPTPPPALVRWLFAQALGAVPEYKGIIGRYPGAKVGEFVLTPNIDSEALQVWDHIRIVLGMTVGILALNVLIYWPVRRALAPTDQMLAVLERMESGDLSARMPRPSLIELRRIAAGFDHLSEQLQKTMAEQRHLAQRLLAVREEERRFLARELHDEFGQCLTSVGADAAYLTEQARQHQPELLPAAQSVASVTAHMMESLQGILGQLRPVGLDEFGLSAALEQLVSGWQRRTPSCGFSLKLHGPVDDLPSDLSISLFRIAQESLTNALRHSTPSHVSLHLRCGAQGCTLSVSDDGSPHGPSSAGSGLGVLGMNERVAALGGRFALGPLHPQGTRVLAEFPPEATQHAPDPATPKDPAHV